MATEGEGEEVDGGGDGGELTADGVGVGEEASGGVEGTVVGAGPGAEAGGRVEGTVV